MPGVLYVVATPIGNLEDITLRALRVLREATVIAAEDTRRTARLLQHYSISTPTTSLHEHNEHSRTPALLARLAAGDSVALVSDAGTPLISDPGAELVASAHAAGIRVEPVPGPSAAVAVLSGSGIASGEFVFLGFPPARSKARREWLTALAAEPRALVFYEAPHRIRETLEEMLAVFGNRNVALGREVTKAHEELIVLPLTEHISRLRTPRGEYTCVVGPALETMATSSLPEPDPRVLAAEFGRLMDIGSHTRREALRALADKYGLPSNRVYKLIEQGKTSVD